MTLQEKLKAHKLKSSAKRSPEVAAILERGTEQLRASGIMDRALKVGARAPEFALPNQRGELVRSAELLGRGLLVLTFYRGHW